jgi:peptidoglycan/xylan/chitin deacetylase (PgdA/CDA1 family)
LYVSPKLFRTQILELHRAGYQTFSLSRFEDPASRPQSSLALTFDDGFQNVLENAMKPLAVCGFTAIQFLVANRLGARNDWEMAEGEVPERLMDVLGVRDWLAAGHEIGSHTLTHPYLTRIPKAQAEEEILSSKKKLEDLFGVTVRHFCYPYGDCDPTVVDLVRKAGYQTGCTTRTGINTTSTPRHELSRFTVRYRSRGLRTLKEWLVRS